MNTQARLKAIEKKIEKTGVSNDWLKLSPIIYRQDGSGNKIYRVKRGNEWLWLKEKKAYTVIEKAQTESPYQGLVIFAPEKVKELDK